MYGVFADIATGVENATDCHPDPLSEVNVACASTDPPIEYSTPMCVPLSDSEPFQKRMPLTVPATSERNFTPSVTGLSRRHASLRVATDHKDTPAGAGLGGGGGTMLEQELIAAA